MPADYKFKPTAVPPRIESSEPSIFITRDQEIRIRILSAIMSATQVSVVGSIREDYLGVLGTTAL